MRHENAPARHRHFLAPAQLGKRIAGSCVTLAARNRLHVAMLRLRDGADFHRRAREGNAQHLGELSREFGICVGIGTPQAVVHMQQGKRPDLAARPQAGSKVGHRRGIGTARHHEQHRRGGRCEPAHRNQQVYLRFHVNYHDCPRNELAGNSGSLPILSGMAKKEGFPNCQ